MVFAMRKPTTALLIPCYNAEPYLENLRKQVDALDPAFDELVIVDDGSTDGTVEKARALGFDIVPLETNRGPGAARNAAAERATAEWIHFLDADDEIAADYLAKVLPIASDGVDVVLCSCDLLKEETRELMMRWSFDDALFSTEPLKGCMRTGVNTPSSLLRRSVFEKIGGFDETHRCWEDGDMHLRLALVGAKFRCIPDVLSFGIRHRRGTSGNKLYCHRCRLDFLEKYTDYVPRIPAEDLVNETLIIATRLNAEGDKSNVGRALDLACRLGWRGPESGHPLVACLARIPSKRLRKALFRLQGRVRAAQLG
jgi:glycosyltransferase involved in cell wall biosynthesis